MSHPAAGNSPPPPSEDIHLPGPSYLPALVALGITVALVGVLLSWFVFAAGVILFVIPLVLWIREAREELAELPLEH